MDVTQILIVVTLVVTIVVLSLVGYYLVRILMEVRSLLKRADSVVNGFERVGSGVENGFNDMMGFVGGMKSVFHILEIFRKRNDKSSDDSYEQSNP